MLIKVLGNHMAILFIGILVLTWSAVFASSSSARSFLSAIPKRNHSVANRFFDDDR